MNRFSPPRFRRLTAFTLIELLVSTVVLLLILGIIGSMFNAFSQGHRSVTRSMQSFEEVRTIASLIGRDIGSAMVRDDPNRWLNLKVVQEDDRVAIYFAAPDEQVETTARMSFISHYCYFWNRETATVHRAISNSITHPDALFSTASHPRNEDENANIGRLSTMTLAYSGGSPYAWTVSAQMKDAERLALEAPMLRNIFSFEVRSQIAPPSDAQYYDTVWSDHTSLPHYIELHIGVANERNAMILRQDPTRTELLRKFVITVPMINHGINSNRHY